MVPWGRNTANLPSSESMRVWIYWIGSEHDSIQVYSSPATSISARLSTSSINLRLSDEMHKLFIIAEEFIIINESLKSESRCLVSYVDHLSNVNVARLDESWQIGTCTSHQWTGSHLHLHRRSATVHAPFAYCLQEPIEICNLNCILTMRYKYSHSLSFFSGCTSGSLTPVSGSTVVKTQLSYREKGVWSESRRSLPGARRKALQLHVSYSDLCPFVFFPRNTMINDDITTEEDLCDL